jgi:selenide, water dikinase
MLGYQQLPDKSKMVVDPALEISNRVLLQQVVASVADKVGDILNHSKMRCGGCGSKIGSQILTRALEAVSRADACATTVDSRTQLGAFRSEVVTGVGDDAALLTSPASSLLTVQTIDYFRSFISDPFLFGKIAANHALSDLHAMNAEPVSALALCVLPFGREEKVENDLVQMIAGACSVLKLENCALVGGHSSEGSEMYVLINALHPFHTLHAECTFFFSSSNKWIYLLLSCLARSMGLSLHGTVHPGEVLRKGPLVSGDVLVLTKALGTGVILAADMRTAAKGAWVSDAIQSMLLSNKRASQILRSRGSSACTDVTGFGLLGHLLEMLQCDRGSAFCSITPHQEKLAAQLYMKDIPLLAGAIECLSAGIISSLQVQVNFSYKYKKTSFVVIYISTSHHQNVRSSKAIGNAGELDFVAYPLLFDPQTAGGLLASIPAAQAAEAIAELRSNGYLSASIIGHIGTVRDFNKSSEENAFVWLV